MVPTGRGAGEEDEEARRTLGALKVRARGSVGLKPFQGDVCMQPELSIQAVTPAYSWLG